MTLDCLPYFLTLIPEFINEYKKQRNCMIVIETIVPLETDEYRRKQVFLYKSIKN